MSEKISNEIVQLNIPVTNISENVDWYVNVFDFEIISKNNDEAHLKLKQGPLIFLRRITGENPLKFMLNDRVHPIISFKTSDLDKCHQRIKEMSVECGDIVTYGEGVNGLYRDFTVVDPNGHLIEVNSYPDLALSKFRGY